MEECVTATVKGIPLLCKHCGYNRFFARRAEVNTALATFFGFDALNQPADIFVCTACGYCHWFLNTETDVEAADTTDDNYDIACLSCGAIIPAGQFVCRNCGWTYVETAS